MRKLFRRSAVAIVLIVTLFAQLVATCAADGDKRLDRVKGLVGFEEPTGGKFHSVFGKIELPDDDIAETRDNSAAIVTLPDSSIVALGQETRVRIGAFNTTAEGPGSTITVENGTLRFDIRRPVGGTANFHFNTVTSQIAVRGTIGLLSFINGQTVVACLVCQVDSVSVTVGTQTFTVAAGQAITVSAAGSVATGAVTNSMLSTFSSTQVSTATASGTSAATSGVSGAASSAAGAVGGAAGTAAAGAATGAIAGSVAAAAVVTGVVAATASKSTPTPTPTLPPTPPPTSPPTPVPVPTASPSPNAPIQLQSKAKAAATPPAPPAPVAPVLPKPSHAPAGPAPAPPAAPLPLPPFHR